MFAGKHWSGKTFVVAAAVAAAAAIAAAQLNAGAPAGAGRAQGARTAQTPPPAIQWAAPPLRFQPGPAPAK